jgi:hypothetical protein
MRPYQRYIKGYFDIFDGKSLDPVLLKGILTVREGHPGVPRATFGALSYGKSSERYESRGRVPLMFIYLFTYF